MVNGGATDRGAVDLTVRIANGIISHSTANSYSLGKAKAAATASFFVSSSEATEMLVAFLTVPPESSALISSAPLFTATAPLAASFSREAATPAVTA